MAGLRSRRSPPVPCRTRRRGLRRRLESAGPGGLLVLGLGRAGSVTWAAPFEAWERPGMVAAATAPAAILAAARRAWPARGPGTAPECLVLEDCVGSYFPEFHEVGLRMIAAQGGIFGWVTPSPVLLDALAALEGEA